MSQSVTVRFEQLRVGQVVDEDERWLTLRIAKDQLATYDADEGRCLTLLFVQSDGQGGIKADFPWENE